jgi:hypothetical protein
MTSQEIKSYLGKSVVVTSKKLSMSIVGYVEAVICEVAVIQSSCCWGVACEDITEIKERDRVYKSVIDA